MIKKIDATLNIVVSEEMKKHESQVKNEGTAYPPPSSLTLRSAQSIQKAVISEKQEEETHQDKMKITNKS